MVKNTWVKDESASYLLQIGSGQGPSLVSIQKEKSFRYWLTYSLKHTLFIKVKEKDCKCLSVHLSWCHLYLLQHV